MQLNPLIHIIFYLATLFLPDGTAKFTVSSGYEQKITWVRQVDGAWQATTENGKDAGLWSIDGFVVSVTKQGQTAKTDVSRFVKVSTIEGQTKQVSVADHPVTVSINTPTVTFSQDKDGPFAKPVVVTYSAK